MGHGQRRRRLLMLAGLLAAVLVACFSHALSADGGPGHAPPAAAGAVSQHDGAAHQPLASAAPAEGTGCGHGCSADAAAGALMCAMAAVAAIGAVALARPSRPLLPGPALFALPRSWVPTPAVPRPPSLSALCISRT